MMARIAIVVLIVVVLLATFAPAITIFEDGSATIVLHSPLR